MEVEWRISSSFGLVMVDTEADDPGKYHEDASSEQGLSSEID